MLKFWRQVLYLASIGLFVLAWRWIGAGKYTDSFGLWCLEGALWFASLLALLLTIRRVSAYRRMGLSPTRAMARMMTRVWHVSRHANVPFGDYLRPGPLGLVALALLASFAWLGDTLWLAGLAALLMFYVRHRLLRAYPPLVLYLAASGRGADKTQSLIDMRLRGRWRDAFGTLALTKGSSPWRLLLWRSCVRTVSEADWRSVVQFLVSVAGVVVVDTREPSTTVDEEFRLVSDGPNAFKLVEVVDFDKQKEPQRTDRFLRLSQHNLCTLLTWMVKSPANLPRPDRSPAEWLCACIAEHGVARGRAKGATGVPRQPPRRPTQMSG